MKFLLDIKLCCLLSYVKPGFVAVMVTALGIDISIDTLVLKVLSVFV